MLSRHTTVALALCALATSACRMEYPEEPAKREMAPPDKDPTKLTGPATDRECRYDRTHGCIAGQIVVAPVIYVEGKEYFDGETFGRDLPKLVTIKGADGKPLTAADVQVSVEPAVTNQTFLRDFEVFVKGERAASQRVNDRGAFKFNFMEPGDYDLRAQRTFLLKLMSLKALAPGETPKTRVLCATVYAEALGLEVVAAEKFPKSFDNFRIQLRDEDCKQALNESVVTF